MAEVASNALLIARSKGGRPATALSEIDVEGLRQGLVWMHLTANDRAAATRLLTELGFHHLAIEDALNESERPALHHYDHTVFLSATTVNVNGDGSEDYFEFGLFVGSTFVVSVTTRPCACLEASFQRWMANPHGLGKNPAFLLHTILDSIVDEYFPASDHLEDRIDAMEEEVYSGDRDAITEALQLKRRLLRMRRHVVDARDILNALLRGDGSLLTAEARPYFQDVYDHALRIAENLDLNRDILATIMDTQLSIVSNNLNRSMKIMTATATILMSMGLIAGIYGMNFAYIPELHWRYGYQFAWAFMGFVAVVEWVVFKRLGWF
ncbi:MAG: magnesium/cobalt transporter CorA [Fimbriimonadaceae bacterium]|nr:magnesium/cobalt transporter CorA [Fimbriimonadaceae bacterium]